MERSFQQAGPLAVSAFSLSTALQMRDYVLFYVNGKRYRIHGQAAFAPLAEFLRAELGLTGTKIVCAEGDCGACTVLVGKLQGRTLCYHTLTSCIQSLFQLDCKHIITIEGLKENGDLSPVQEALVNHHGSQCGFCTPGIVMALTQLFDADRDADRAALKTALTGNLCRCTGYVPILESALAADRARIRPLADRFETQAMVQDFELHTPVPVMIAAAHTDGDGPHHLYYSPRQLADAVAFKARHPDATLISGGTELGLMRNKTGAHPPKLLSLSGVAGMSQIHVDLGSLVVGANATWAQLEAFTRTRLPEIHKMTRLFASPQIRNVATLAGNIAYGSPVADSSSLLMIAEAVIELAGKNGPRRVPIADFFKGYKTVDIQRDELIARVVIPLPADGEVWKLYKVSKRKEMDITTFRAAVRIGQSGEMITRAAVAISGASSRARRLPETEAFLAGKPFSEETFRKAGRRARAEIEPISDLRGSRAYRLQLVENVLLKFYFDCAPVQPQEAPFGG
jgi:xanthine dehydrogenase small subunit